MMNRMVGSVLTLLTLLFSAGDGVTQTYTQMQWGMNKGVTPYTFGANINGTWRDLGTVSSTGVWTINANNTWVSVDSFGAVGDGVTNDAVALTAAMSSLGAKGGVVFLSCKKDYAILSNINVPNNVTIVHCQYPHEYGFIGTGTPNGASLTLEHVNLGSSVSFTMNGNTGYYGAVFRAGQTYPSTSIAGYAGTAFRSAAGNIQDIRINALVVGFAICYNGTNRVDRLILNMECDANPSATDGSIILGPSADTSRIKARSWPWGTYSQVGAPVTRTGYGLKVLSGLQDDTHIDYLDFGHTFGVVTEASGNVHWEHIWTDNNAQYGFLASAGDRSTIDAMWLYKSRGARFNANGTWNIGYYLCDNVSVASAECIETAGGISPNISVNTLYVTNATVYAINIGSTTARININNATILNVNGGVPPYIVGVSGWTTDQIQFASTPKTDLANGASLLGGNSISPPSIASATTLALPVNADNFYVTGTTSITNITGTYGGRTVVLTFRDALTLTNSATIALANGYNFVTATGSSIALQFDQVSNVWRELWRSPFPTVFNNGITVGVEGSTVGSVAFKNATSGTITLQPATGALGTVTATLPANTGTIAELNLAQTFSAGQTFSSAIISAGTPPTATGSGGTCAAGAVAGGALVGTVTLTAVCASTNTLALTGMPAVTTGYVCDAADRTNGALNLVQTATTTTGATFTFNATTGATDVIQFKCMGY